MDRPTSIFSQKPTSTDTVTVTVLGTTSATADILSQTDHPVAAVETKSKALVIPSKSFTEQQIIKLGSTSGQTISSISGKILELHKGNNQGEMGDKLNELIKTAKGLSSENYKPGFVGGLLQKFKMAKYDMTHQFDSAKDRVDSLVKELDKEKNVQMQTCNNVDALIVANGQYCKALIQEIGEGSQMLEAVADEIAQYGDILEPEEARSLAETRNRYDMLEKKLVDLEGFKVLSMNMDPKLVAMKASAHSLINTFDMIVTKMVPSYMLVFAQYLASKDMERAQQLADQTTDAYNEIIKQNGDMTVSTMEKTARLKNRQMISVDVLKDDHEKMITGLNNLRQIEEQARIDRAKTLNDLREIEQKTIEAFSRK